MGCGFSALVLDYPKIENQNHWIDLNISVKNCNSPLNALLNFLAETMIKGDRIEIRGLCSFFIKEYTGYSGRNPKTGKKVMVPAKRLPFFNPGKELKERVDYPN